ncbi:MAG: hypothetical protein LBS52_02500 [Dysgonamonadaceae bacterium]|jgi:hypothetical protein|nr:hypothetical protein [Dysgonamonadaceae bacterium]
MFLDQLRKIRDCCRNPYNKYVYPLSISGKPDWAETVHCDSRPQKDGIDIVTVAFNDERLIDKQSDLVKKHIRDENYTQIIVDNSTDKGKRRLIRDLCIRKNLVYVPVPRHIHRLIATRVFGGALSHAAALNWAYYNLLKEREMPIILFLDHDMMPMNDYRISEALGNQDFYGVKRDRADGWYVWAGFCAFRFAALSRIKPNFLPIMVKNTFLDTGGGNYPVLYRDYNIGKINFAPAKIYRIRKPEGNSKRDYSYHLDCVQVIDRCWLHIIQASNFAKIKGKDDMVNLVLDNLDKIREKINHAL